MMRTGPLRLTSRRSVDVPVRIKAPVPGGRWPKAPSADRSGDRAEIAATVAQVLAEVEAEGDAAVRHCSIRFDGIDLDAFEVTMADRMADRLAATAALDPQTRADTGFAIANVRAFAKAQFVTILPLEVEIRPGVHMVHRVIPIERVG